MSIERKAPVINLSRRDVLSGLTVGAVTLMAGGAARAQCTPTSTPTTSPSAGIKPIYLYHPISSSLTTDILAAYNARKTTIVYQNIVDYDANGTWDGKTSAYNSKVSGISTSFTCATAIDWEHRSGWTGGFLGTLGGLDSIGNQQLAASHALAALKAFKGDRPNTKWGFYSSPYIGSQNNLLNPSAKFLAQEALLYDLWATEDHIAPRTYCTFQIGTSTNLSGGTVTQSDLQKMMTTLATLCLRCSASGGYHAQVLPFHSTQYYNSSQSFNRTLAPAATVYWHVYYFAKTTYNGKSSQGLTLWGGTSATPLDEPYLKAVYQGLNGLPFDPKMPRPTQVAAQ